MTLDARRTVLNFAYGSNMLVARIRERAPSARPLGVAELRGHELRWHKAGMDGSAKCDVVASSDPRAVVFGVVYELSVADKALLDRAEGLGIGYAEARAVVQRGDTSVETLVYCATRIDSSLKPFSWYRALVVAGAAEHRFPRSYIAALEAVDCVADPDRARHARHMAIAVGR